MKTTASVAQTIEAHAPDLMALEYVVGVGAGLCNSKPCIRVYLSESNPAALEQIPAEIDGYPVVTEVSGKPKAGL